jgi:hypothetical protein
MQHRRRTMPVRTSGARKSGAGWAVAVVAVAGFGFAGGYAASAPDQARALAQSTMGQFGLAGCDIKGNISINSGERIYHVRGQRHYEETVIRLEYGERYFCSEQEARAAGWRRSGV